MNDNKFADQFTAILSTMCDLHGNFGMYQHAIGEENKKIYVQICNDIRQKLIDFISEMTIEYQGRMDETIRDLLIGSDELEDIAAAGYLDYQHYTLEVFLNKMINDAYRIHNEIIMNAWMTSINIKFSEIIN